MAWGQKEELLFVITLWILAGITFLGLAARIFVRVHARGSILHRKSWHWSDILLVIAWLGLLTSAIVNLVMLAGYQYNPTKWEEHAGEKRYVITRKLYYAYVLTLWTSLFLFVKLSLLFFFNELVDRYGHFKVWLAIRITGLLVLLVGIAVSIYGALWCQPVSRNWTGGNAYCWFAFDDRFRFTIVRQLTHVITDVMMRQRVGVAMMFALGLFCTICSIIFMIGVLQWDHETLQTDSAVAFLQYEPPVELSAAILIQCVPAIRAFRGVYSGRHKSIVETSGGEIRAEEELEGGMVDRPTQTIDTEKEADLHNLNNLTLSTKRSA